MEREGSNPVAPFPTPPSYLVLHKLKEWDECQTRAYNTTGSNDQSAHLDSELRVVRKQLYTMLTTLRNSVPKFNHDPTYDPNLHNESAPRVDRFLAAHSCYGKEWRRMGFRPNEGSSPPSERLVRPKRKEFGIMQIRSLAAQTTVAILTELGLPCAIFGSMACKIYGNRRIPNVRSFFCPLKFTLITCNRTSTSSFFRLPSALQLHRKRSKASLPSMPRQPITLS